MTTLMVFVLAFALGFACGFLLVRSERTYREGWQHGEHYGRAEGYRQAWLKRNKALLSVEREDWNEEK